MGDGNERTGDENSSRRERSETADGRRNPGHGKGSGSRREDSLQPRRPQQRQIAGYLAIARGTVEYHWVEGRYDTLPMLTADLVRRRVAVIVTPGFPLAARAAKDATSAIPIVFGVGEDPVKLGLVG